MGSAWMGTPAHQTGFAQNFNPQQQQLFGEYANQGRQGIGPSPLEQSGSQFIQNLLQSQYNPEQNEQLFQSGVVNPALKTYEQQVLPMLKSQYYSPSGTYGSALNRAITQSSNELQGGLNALRSNYLMQGQQDYGNRQLSALGQALGFSQAPFNRQQSFYSQVFGANPVTPMIQQDQSGWLKDLVQGLIAAAGQAGRGYFQGKGG